MAAGRLYPVCCHGNMKWTVDAYGVVTQICDYTFEVNFTETLKEIIYFSYTKVCGQNNRWVIFHKQRPSTIPQKCVT